MWSGSTRPNDTRSDVDFVDRPAVSGYETMNNGEGGGSNFDVSSRTRATRWRSGSEICAKEVVLVRASVVGTEASG